VTYPTQEHPWGEAEEARARELWESGLAGSAVALVVSREFGTARSRSAVISLGNRHGWPAHRTNPPRSRHAPPVARRPRTPSTGPSEPDSQPLPLMTGPVAESRPRTLAELAERGECRWPLDGGMYCGAPAGGRYCPAHAAASLGKRGAAGPRVPRRLTGVSIRVG